MHATILVLLYVAAAFLPVLFFHFIRDAVPRGRFWMMWVLSLIGAFLGGMGGTIVIAKLGWDSAFIGSLMASLAGAWIMTAASLKLRDLPEAI